MSQVYHLLAIRRMARRVKGGRKLIGSIEIKPTDVQFPKVIKMWNTV